MINAQRMRELAQMLKKEIPDYGFCIITFPLNTNEGEINYVSNAQREDMIIALSELLQKWLEENPKNN